MYDFYIKEILALNEESEERLFAEKSVSGEGRPLLPIAD